MSKVLFLEDTFTVVSMFMVINTIQRSKLGEVNAVKLLKGGSFKLDPNEPMETIQSFCPTSFCSTNEEVNRFGDNGNHCCIPCDCSRTCNNTETDVMVDKKQPDDEFIVEKCIKTSVTGPAAFKKDTDEYLLIQSCPRYELKGKNREIAGKCLQPNERKLDEIIPVYSNTTGRNYRNVYCATCNKDYSVKAWRSRLMCQNYLWLILVPSSANRGSHFLHQLRTAVGNNGCILKWEPVRGTAILCIDHNTVISSCKPWNSNFEKFKALCLDIYAPVRVDQTIYKNVFCLACNEDIDVCFDSEYVRSTHFSAMFKSEVFAMKQIYETEDIEKIGLCQEDMTYDTLLGQCVKKACPVTQVKAGDTCIPVIEELSGIAFDYRLTLLYPKENFNIPQQEEIFAAVRHLIIHDNDTDICVENILSVTTESQYVSIKIQLTKSVTKPTSYRDDFRKFKDKINLMNVRASNGDFAFTVENFDSPFNPAFGGYIFFAQYLDSKKVVGCFNSIAMAGMNVCDTVLLNEAVCEGNTVTLSNGITFHPWEYIYLFGQSESVYVCYDLYMSKMMTAKGVVSSSSPGITTVHVGLLVTTVIYMIRRVPFQHDGG